MKINTWTADGMAAREAALTTARRRESARGLAARAAAARVLPPGMERPDPARLTALAAALTPPPAVDPGPPVGGKPPRPAGDPSTAPSGSFLDPVTRQTRTMRYAPTVPPEGFPADRPRAAD